MTITKSDFMTFRNCPADFWMKKHKPHLFYGNNPSDFEKQLILQGYEVESVARLLFKDGIEVPGNDPASTSDFLSQNHRILFQPSFAADGLSARVDILVAEDDGLHLYEVKGSTAKEKTREDYHWDAGFQKHVIELAGYKVAKVFLLELNKEYIRSGDIDPFEIMSIKEITQEIYDNHIELKLEVHKAKVCLALATEPISCDCFYKIRNNHCDSFTHFYSIPDYSIHDIINIRRGKIEKFEAEGAISIDDIQDYSSLTDIQLNQVITHQNDHLIIKHTEIRDALDSLTYPLYFLDYETYPSAIPVFDGCFPYQQVPFQYSLHIQNEPDGPFAHKEFLHRINSSPINAIAASLRKDIGDTGSVIVWNQTFEGGRNKELAAANPEFAHFLLGLNDRFFDLMKVFSNQHYVHKSFKGRTSIKKVLPVLCPHLTYETLGIKDGGTASNAWKSMIFDDLSSDQQTLIAHDLLEYCKLDTWAMVEILNVLFKIIS